MSFAFLPWWGVLLGAGVIIAGLFALQHLRAQPVKVKLASLQLWQQAVQQTAANTLWQRFRHWLAFLLSLLIALLLWLALSGIYTRPAEQTLKLFYLDNSVAMGIDDHLAQATSRLIADIKTLPPSRRELWIGAASPAMLLRQGQSNALLAQGLSTLTSGSHLSNFDQWYRTMTARFADPQGVEIYYYGPRRAQDALTGLSPIPVHQAFMSPALGHNKGITGLGQRISEAQGLPVSNVVLSLYSSDSQPFSPENISVTLDKQRLPAAMLKPLGDNQFVLEHLPLSPQSQILSVSLTEDDGLMADNVAAIKLPPATAIKVALQDGLPHWLSQLIQADPGILAVSEQADVSLCLVAQTACPSAAATLYFDASDNVASYTAATADNYTALQQFWRSNHWPAEAQAGAMPALAFSIAQQRSAHLPLSSLNSLLDQQHPDPLLLIAHSIRWLASLAAVPPYSAVAEPIPNWAGASALERPLLAAYPLHQTAPEEYQAQPWIASLQSPAMAADVSHNDTTDSQTAPPRSGLDWMSLCALLALLLLVLEWLLRQRSAWP